VRGPVAAKEYKILVFLYKSFEIFKSILHVETHIIDESLHMLFVSKYCQKIFRKIHPYSTWVVVKEVITKRCFGFRVDAQRSL
jgi:hypothetical protein